MGTSFVGWLMLFCNCQQAGCKQTFRLPFLRHGVTILLLEAARQRAITMVKEWGQVKVIEGFITKKIVPALMPIHRVSG
jgi:hypothetical protein